jgi:hypothetical protein
VAAVPSTVDKVAERRRRLKPGYGGRSQLKAMCAK